MRKELEKLENSPSPHIIALVGSILPVGLALVGNHDIYFGDFMRDIIPYGPFKIPIAMRLLNGLSIAAGLLGGCSIILEIYKGCREQYLRDQLDI